jgi:hypothetical protein
LNRIFNRLSVAAVLAAVCAMPLGAAAQTGNGKNAHKSPTPAASRAAAAQAGSGKSSDSKRALAVKLAQLQQKAEGDSIAQQLTGSAVQPLVIAWSQKLDQTVPPDQQKEVREKLDQELKKFSDAAFKTIQEETARTAEEALVPIFMEKLSESELKTIIAYQESAAAAKFAALGIDAANAWAGQVIERTRGPIEAGGKAFDDAASKIVVAPPPAGSASSASSSNEKK